MFSNSLIMAVKVGGKVLREFDGTVALPFGSEYTIYFKNTSPRRASVDVSIDGEDVLDNHSLIIEPYSVFELKRFVKNGNINNGNAFKFIEKTAKIEKHRGNKAEDGLLTVKYRFEAEKWAINHYPYNTTWTTIAKTNYSQFDPHLLSGSVSTFTSTTDGGDGLPVFSAMAAASCDSAPQQVARSMTNTANYSTTVNSAPQPQNASGVTAPGSVVEQQFRHVYDFVADVKEYTMTIQMVGALGDNKKIEAPVIVKRNVRCTMCGTTCKQTAKFCHECGASVTIV